MIAVIGRGHSGTRIMSHTLSASGVYMGEPRNGAGDLVPAEDMYDAARLLGSHVGYKGDLEWDWEQLGAGIPGLFFDLVRSYLKTVLESSAEHKGWKLPETLLCSPWITRMHPNAKYIYWIRDPRDSILGLHMTDDLGAFGVKYPKTEDIYRRRAISWKYQYDLVQAMPKPKHWIEVRFEDFVLRQDEALARLEDFLNVKLAKIPVYTAPIGRYRTDENARNFSFFAPAMAKYGYED